MFAAALYLVLLLLVVGPDSYFGSTPFIQDRMSLMRRSPGDPVSFETCIEAALGPAEDHAATAIKVRDHLEAIDPNISELVAT